MKSTHRSAGSRVLRKLIPTMLAALLVGCAGAPAGRIAPAQQVLENYLAALNRRDLLALTAYVTPDVEWISIVNGERIVEVDSREALAETLRGYFESQEGTKWGIESATANGAFLAVVERSTWVENGAERSSITLGIYEFQDGRIRRVTYFLPPR